MTYYYSDKYYADLPRTSISPSDAMILLENEIINQLGYQSKPFIQLVIGIMRSGVMDKDIDYFASDTFVCHCSLLGLNADDILQAIVQRKLMKGL